MQRIAKIAATRARAEYDKMLDYKRKADPAAERVNDWEKEYLDEMVKSAEYAFDSQSVRPYFAYDKVRDGVLEVTGTLFGAQFRRVDNDDVWAPEVETYDVYENGDRVGRFYLDMHPRADKYKHAAQFTMVNGVEGKQLPEAALVCNFPKPSEGDPALMEHNDVQTFFHEFGH
ncbi:MAG: peptidase M3, partial [Gammaproteobacteria bacterium]|nr:peptidase M3 [Gammaproteobacteria bacterium]